MIESTPEPAALWLASRLQAESRGLAERWLDRLNALLLVNKQDIFPSQDLLDHIPALILEIAEYLLQPDQEDIAANTAVMRKAAELGELRYTQRASVHQLLREYQMLGELLEEFFEQEVAAATPPVTAAEGVRVMSRAMQALRVLQQQTLDTFVAKYTDTIEQQTARLRSFSRLVSHEIRQPLGVLQVITKTLNVNDGDPESARIMDIFERSVTQLAAVTGKLERLAHLTRATDMLPSEQRVDLSALAADVALQLNDMAAARDVQVRVEENLPVLRLDPARAELVFVNLLANGIKYSDPAKSNRFVEVVALPGESRPTILVRDNGIGVPADKLQNIFREFVRAHAQRDDELGARGLGMGLAIVRECMDAASGSVRVESREGHGTTFKLTWPQPDR